MEYTQEDTTELIGRLRALGRDVYARKGLAYQHFEVDGRVLIEGEHKERCAERVGWIRDLGRDGKLEGKTVIDLGCNLGLFAMEAARQNARLATGIDVQETVIRAAEYIRDFYGLGNCRFRVVDLGREDARAGVEPADVVFAFAVYDHLTGRHKQVHPSERELAYVAVTEWLARITRETLIVEFHNRQEKWAGFFEELLVEHGFEILDRQVTPIERPVFFCSRTRQAHDEIVVVGETFRKLRGWSKRGRALHVVERGGEVFLSKRYSSRDLAEGRRPSQEAAILREFADCSEVLQPRAVDERRIVLPWFEGKPIEVIDSQPVEAAPRLSPAARMRLLSRLAGLIATYMERREALFEKFREMVPEVYREEVRSGDRMLIDLSPSNILIADDGEVRVVDFEPTKPAVTRTVLEHLRGLCSLSGGKTGFFARLFR